MKKSDPIVSGWKNFVVLKTVADIKKLKHSKGSDIQVWGSSKLVQLLLANDLADDSDSKFIP
jgi:dihydrofolate reductase